ncbi:hypothetical protein Tco_0913978 [Tanacetum coccineum]
MAPRDSDDALVCCIQNTVEDRIMDSGASFHAIYCKEELERFKLCSGKVCLANEKTLNIAGVRDVVLKASFGTSWTLKDVRWFGDAEEFFLHNVSKNKETVEVGATRVVVDCDAENGPGNTSTVWVAYSRGGIAREGYKSYTLEAAQMKCDTAFGIRRVTRLSEAEILHLWTRSMKPENDNIVTEHGLSSEITQSPDRASCKEGGSETPQSLIQKPLVVKNPYSRKRLLIEEIVSLEKNKTCSLVRISAGKKASQRLWMFKVKEEQNGKKRYTKSLIHLVKNLKVCSWEKLVRILITEGSFSLLKILKTKSLIEMFTRLVMKEKLKFCAASTSL